MWVLVFIYIVGVDAYAEKYDSYTSMTDCFFAREALALELNPDRPGYFPSGQQALCILSGDGKLL